MARDALEAAAAHQSLDPDPDHGQFYNHGRGLVGLLIALDDLAITRAGQVSYYGDQRLLRDDAGARPEHRLAAAPSSSPSSTPRWTPPPATPTSTGARSATSASRSTPTPPEGPRATFQR